jgi:hypothetical protein
MTALEKVEELKTQAIEILLAEQKQIESQLHQLGYGQENAPTHKRRGRPKQSGPSERQLSLAGNSQAVQP